MQNFSRQVSELLEQLQANNTNPAKLTHDLLWMTTEARTAFELELIEELQQRLPQQQLSGTEEGETSSSIQRQAVVERMLAGDSLRIALINDNGFYAGAGIALARQARSFALAGHQVSVLALNSQPESVLSRRRYQSWLAGHGSNYPIHYQVLPNGISPTDRSGAIDPSDWIAQQQLANPWDLVILGNLHSCKISMKFLRPHLEAGTPLVWFAHDLDLLGGGCAYPQYYKCNQFLTGCADEGCPKPAERYPTASNRRIRKQYLQRSQLFQLPGMQLATHSEWSASQLQDRFPSQQVLKIPLGVDTDVFKPASEPANLRKKLGLDPERFTVVVGADSIGRPGKGGAILHELLPVLLQDPDLQVVCFGHYPDAHPHLYNCGYLDHETSIADVYCCGDIFLNPVTIEAFGQTLLEASACGCVPISLAGTGVDSVIVHQRTGLLCEQAADLHSAVLRLQQNPELRRLMSAKGIETVQHQFSLYQQANRWTEALTAQWGKRKRKSPLTEGSISQRPRLSIVTTTLNCAEPLAATAASLAMQTDQNFEWVVQDGGSHDKTAEVAKHSGVVLSWECSADQGIYDALNQAFQRCRGDWILVLQAGDWLAGPNALEDLFQSVDINQYDILIACFNELSIEGKRQQQRPSNPSNKLADLKSGRFNTPGPHWLAGMPCHQAILMRRTWCQRFPFDLKVRISADWLQMFEVIDAGARVGMSSTELSWYPNGGYSFDHSQVWIENVIDIAKRFQADHAAVDHYFAGALAHHTAMTQQRRHQKLALERWYPSWN